MVMTRERQRERYKLKISITHVTRASRVHAQPPLSLQKPGKFFLQFQLKTLCVLRMFVDLKEDLLLCITFLGVI